MSCILSCQSCYYPVICARRFSKELLAQKIMYNKGKMESAQRKIPNTKLKLRGLLSTTDLIK